jgi:hypothetical protein
METAIVAINLSDKQQSFFVDLKPLERLFKTALVDTSIVAVTNLLPALNHHVG